MKIIRSYIYLLIALTLAVLAMLAVSGCNSQKHITENRFDSTWTKNVQDSNRLLRQEVEKLTGDIQQLIYAGVYFDTVYLKGDTVRDTITNTVVIKTDGSIDERIEAEKQHDEVFIQPPLFDEPPHLEVTDISQEFFNRHWK